LIQSIPSHPISLTSILLLSTHLRHGLISGLFPSGFLINILYAFLVSPIRATCPAHLMLLNLSTLIIFGKAYKLRRSSLCIFLQSPVTSSSFRIFYQNFLRNSLRSHACYRLCYLVLFDLNILIIMNHVILQIYSVSHCFIPLRPKYSR
jgi:hypothetical protein